MSVRVVKFNTQNRPEFFKELRARVNNYFIENNISKHANINMKLKTIFMICLYFVPLFLMLFGVLTTFWPVMAMWILMGFGMAGIGMGVMHDANHRSYSASQNVNTALGYLINFIGGYHINWKIQHNILHHSYTNVEGMDEDLETGLMRFSPSQERKGVHRFQAIYAPFLYGFLTMNWLIKKDFAQLIRYNKKNLLEGRGLTVQKAFKQVLFNKIWYFALTLVLPLIFVPLAWWQILIGFFMMQFICGSVLSYIFQLAHVIEETDFYIPDEKNSVENSWAIHQMHTTANFANSSVFFSWFIGGLNYQIEHHLFPNICHVHYRKIASIVKKTAEEYKVPYYQHKTFVGALGSHFSLLNQLGTGAYDKKLAKAS